MSMYNNILVYFDFLNYIHSINNCETIRFLKSLSRKYFVVFMHSTYILYQIRLIVNKSENRKMMEILIYYCMFVTFYMTI